MTEVVDKDANETSTSTPTKEVPPGYTVLKEGQASILQHGNAVFYNPAQVINRDLSIAVLKYFIERRKEEIASGKLKPHRTWSRQQGGPAYVPETAKAGTGNASLREGGDGIRVLEGLAATGLRSIRYACEVEGIRSIDANDLEEGAVEAIRRNVDFTGGLAAQKVNASRGDARMVMLQNAGSYDAVDIDPYGSPSHLLDSAVQACSEGGLLLVTATDMAVLCGNNGESCFAKYGSYPLHRPYCHEQALRILLASLEMHAARYKRYIKPILSVSIDFYVRVFVRVYTGAEVVKDAPTKLAYVWQSQGCDSFYMQHVGRKRQQGKGWKRSPGQGPPMPEKCPETGAGYLMGGPFWASPIHDPDWVAGIQSLIQREANTFPSAAKMQSVLTLVGEELLDVPLYYSAHELAKTCRTPPPPADVLRSAIVNAGYRVSSTHANPLGIKTDCPPHVLWDIMRCWVLQHPGKPISAEGQPYLHTLLSKEPQMKANFARASGALSQSRQKKLTRFPDNPQPNWGPKPKHSRYHKGGEGQRQNGTADVAAGNPANGEAGCPDQAMAGRPYQATGTSLGETVPVSAAQVGAAVASGEAIAPLATPAVGTRGEVGAGTQRENGATLPGVEAQGGAERPVKGTEDEVMEDAAEGTAAVSVKLAERCTAPVLPAR